MNEDIPDEISRILGHPSHRSCKRKSRGWPRRWHSLTKTGMRCYRCLTWISYFRTHFNKGNPLSFPNIQRGSSASCGGRSPVNRSYAKVQAWLNLKHMTTLYNYIKRSLKQTSNKKVRPHEIQEGDFVPKRVLSFQPDSKGKWTPNYEGSCAIHLQLWMVTNSHVLWKLMQSRNTLSKMKARWVANLKKRLRQKWASRSTENLKGRSKQKLETWTKMIILIDWKPERAIYAKVKDQRTK